jgi:hypothetical protein
MRTSRHVHVLHSLTTWKDDEEDDDFCQESHTLAGQRLDPNPDPSMMIDVDTYLGFSQHPLPSFDALFESCLMFYIVFFFFFFANLVGLLDDKRWRLVDMMDTVVATYRQVTTIQRWDVDVSGIIHRYKHVGCMYKYWEIRHWDRHRSLFFACQRWDIGIVAHNCTVGGAMM